MSSQFVCVCVCVCLSVCEQNADRTATWILMWSLLNTHAAAFGTDLDPIEIGDLASKGHQFHSDAISIFLHISLSNSPL